MVHASQYYFHFDFYDGWDFDLMFRLNKTLPNDISIFEIIPMDGYPHAQTNAISRTYDYLIHTNKDPHLSELSSLYPQNIDIKQMHNAVMLIPSHSDFINFCLCPINHRSTHCRVSSARLFVHKTGNMVRFQITSNRFLQGMVRLLVQGLIDVGSGELSLKQFEALLNTSEPNIKNKPAYPQGLYLSEVKYPFIEKPKESPFFSLLNYSDWEELK